MLIFVFRGAAKTKKHLQRVFAKLRKCKNFCGGFSRNCESVKSSAAGFRAPRKREKVLRDVFSNLRFCKKNNSTCYLNGNSFDLFGGTVTFTFLFVLLYLI
jgi:hypothetical protein